MVSEQWSLKAGGFLIQKVSNTGLPVCDSFVYEIYKYNVNRLSDCIILWCLTLYQMTKF